MKYSEAYELITNDFEAKLNLHKKFAKGQEMFDFKHWSDSPSGRAHRNYFDSLATYNEFLSIVFDKNLNLKVDPNSEVDEHWKEKVEAIKKSVIV